MYVLLRTPALYLYIYIYIYNPCAFPFSKKGYTYKQILETKKYISLYMFI